MSKEQCPNCGQTDYFGIKRDMTSERVCKCGSSWPAPQVDKVKTVNQLVPMEQKDLTTNHESGLVRKNDQVERIQTAKDLVGSVFYKVQELKAIYLHNFNLGIKFNEIGPYDAPLDYKLNQLDEIATKLQKLFEGNVVPDPEPPPWDTPKAKIAYSGPATITVGKK